MTSFQRSVLARLLRELAPAEFHHGMCCGADAEAHQEALGVGVPTIVVHPSTDSGLTADLGDEPPHAMIRYLAPADPLTRNKAIVRSVEALIAAPASAIEETRSGTWYTIRFARRQQGMRIIVLSPDGGVL